MTAVSPSKDMWSSMAGWGIVANLLPPEVVSARKVRRLRKLMTIVLLAVVLLCAAGYGVAYWKAHTASSALSAEQNRGAGLAEEQRKFADVVQIEGTIARVKSQVGSLLGNDVDFAQLINGVVAKLPSGAALTNVGVTIDAGGSTSSAAGAATGGAALDTSGRPHIGAIMLTGQAHSLDQVARFVTSVATVPGIVGVFPSSQQGSGTVVQFTMQLTLTDQVLSHRYAATGGK